MVQNIHHFLKQNVVLISFLLLLIDTTSSIGGLNTAGRNPTFCVISPEPTVEWDRVVENGSVINDESLCQNENGTLITGSIGGDAALIQMDGNGKIVWTKTYGGPLVDTGYCVRQTSDGGYIITGETHYYQDFIRHSAIGLWRTDRQGNLLWNKSMKFGDAAIGDSIRQTADNGFIILGSNNKMNCWVDILAIKTDAEGNIQWNRSYGGQDAEIGVSIDIRSEGGYLLLGWTESFGERPWLLDIDESGNVIENRTIPGTAWASAMSRTSDGGHIITGHYDRLIQGIWNMDVWVLKLDAVDQVEWNKTYGGDLYEWGGSVQQTSDGGYVITGVSMTGYWGGNYSFSLIRLDADGTLRWNRTISNVKCCLGCAVTQTADGMFLVAGCFGNNLWILKLSDKPARYPGKVIVLGTIMNLEAEGVFMTFQARNIILFGLHPLQINHYSNSEYVSTSINYKGMVKPGFIAYVSDAT